MFSTFSTCFIMVFLTCFEGFQHFLRFFKSFQHFANIIRHDEHLRIKKNANEAQPSHPPLRSDGERNWPGKQDNLDNSTHVCNDVAQIDQNARNISILYNPDEKTRENVEACSKNSLKRRPRFAKHRKTKRFCKKSGPYHEGRGGGGVGAASQCL